MPRFLKTSAFRLTLAYTAVFGLSVLLLLTAIYWTTAQNISRTIDDSITSDIDALAQHYNTRGLAGLVDAVGRRMGPANVSGSLYLLTDPKVPSHRRQRLRLAGQRDGTRKLGHVPAGW